MTTEKVSEQAYMFPVRGHAMEGDAPHAIYKGDMVLVDADDKIKYKDGDVVLVEINGELAPRILKCDEGRRYLKSLNPDYPSIQEPFNILALIVAVQKSVRAKH